jgi:hypothetical protein
VSDDDKWRGVLGRIEKENKTVVNSVGGEGRNTFIGQQRIQLKT